jgi:hypothetical protein
MRRGGITSASDRRVSSDEQPSRTNGVPDGRSAKPKRAKRGVLRRERLSSAIRFPQIVCGSISVARVGVPARVPRGEARRKKANSRAVCGGSFDSAPGLHSATAFARARVRVPIKPPLMRLYALWRDCANLCLVDRGIALSSGLHSLGGILSSQASKLAGGPLGRPQGHFQHEWDNCSQFISILNRVWG